MFNSVNRFVRKISKVKVKSFSADLLGKVNDYLDNKDSLVEINKNDLIIKNSDGYLEVYLENNKISYRMKYKNISVIGEYVPYKNGYFVRFMDEESTSYDIGDSYSRDIKHRDVFKKFNKEGVEEFRRVTIKFDNYDEDKITKKTTLHEPDIMENYTENDYMWRVDGKYIIKRNIRKYIYPDGTPAFIDINSSDDCYLRYQMVSSDTKEIPDYGEYYGIDRNVFFNYFQKKSNIGDVVENFHSKKYVKRSVEF